MDRIKDRIPAKQEALLLFSACAFLIHVWAIVMFLYETPAYMSRMLLADMLGIFAYSQAFALIESLLFWGFLAFVCISLPRKLFKDWFVSQGALIALCVFIFVVPIHYQISIIEGLQWNMGLYRMLVVGWVLLCLAGLFGTSLLIRRRPKFAKSVADLVERITLLSVVYVTIDLLSFGFIIYRNIR